VEKQVRTTERNIVKITSNLTRVVTILLVVLILVAMMMDAMLPIPIHADAASAQLRITQISYRTIKENESADIEADIYVDNRLVAPWTAVRFPFDTDYQGFIEGKHTLTVVMTGEKPDQGQSIDVNLAADHRYNLVAYGDFAGKTSTVRLIPLDETALLAGSKIAADASALIVVNLTDSASPLDIHFDDKLVVQAPSGGKPVALELPKGKFHVKVTSPDMPDKAIQDFDAVSFPASLTTVIAWGKTPDNVTVQYARSSSLKIGSWLTTVGVVQGADFSAGFSRIARVLKAAELLDELNGDGPFTIFAPLDDAPVPEGMVISGPALVKLLKYHIVPGRYAPNDLRHKNQLTTLQGGNLTFNYGKTTSGLWEINDGTGIEYDVRLANGVLYAIDGILTPKP